MFTIHKYDSLGLSPWEYIPAAAGTYHVGELLNVSGGKLAAIAATETGAPPYICMAERTVAAGETLPVIRNREDMILASELSADYSALAIGTKVAVATGGLKVISGNGKFEITGFDGTTAGDRVYGRFAI